MVKGDACSRSATGPPLGPMGVIEAGQALAVRTMQGQRIIEPVRLGRANRDAFHREPNPILSARIDDKNLPVEVKQGVKRAIAFHDLSLSHYDM
jgi:hypothetical protein